MPLWRMIVTAINLVGVRFMGAGIGLVSQILLTRLMSQADVGIVFLGMSSAAILSLLVTVGYPQLALTCLPRYYALGRKNLAAAFHAAFWRDGLVALAVVAAVVVAAAIASPLSPGLKTALVFGLLSSPASAFIRINSAAANSLRRFALSYVPDFIYRPALLLIYLVFAWGAGFHLTAIAVLWAFVIGNSMVALGQALIIGKHGAVPPRLHSGLRNLAPLLRRRAGALVIVAAVSNSFADMVNMIGGVLLPHEDVALLGVCIRLAALIGFITQATQNFILPDLAVALTRGNRAELDTLLLRFNGVALAAIGASLAGTAAVGQYALRIFGPEYVAGHWPLVVFTLSQGFRAASGMNQHLLSLGGYQTKTGGACVLAIVSLGGAAALLTPQFGVMGMAVAVVIADVVWALLLAVLAQRHTGRRGDILALLRARR